jgi:bifunctional ADP-heptose synthase (sugar kinase/adenylyltransferase)
MSAADFLPEEILERFLARLPALRVAVLGDLFLDRYLDLDAALTEPSLETGLDAYQVVNVRPLPGAAGTVLNNLVALGVGRVWPVAVIGDDGEGYELTCALRRLPGVEAGAVFARGDRRTPTYAKPLLHRAGAAPEELNRLDFKNRSPLPADAEAVVLDALADLWARVDALLVLDQVSEPDCGVVTARVRDRLAELGEKEPGRLILADSRERIGLFRSVWLKPNRDECRRAVPPGADAPARELARRAGRPVFCTLGADGILLADPARHDDVRIPGFPVRGPIDPVGAGDSTSAGIACAAAAGAAPEQAAAFGNLVASVTVGQLGTTGTASPADVRRRWREACGRI